MTRTDPRIVDLKARVSVEAVLVQMGARFQNTSLTVQEAPFFCPFCDDIGSDKPAGRANDLEGLWHCWSCNRGGDVFTAVMEGKGLKFDEAFQWLLDTYPDTEVSFDPWGDRP